MPLQFVILGAFDGCNYTQSCSRGFNKRKNILGPVGGVKNLQVTDPTISTLNVRWEPAEGNVRQYRVIYVPAAGGSESMVGHQNHFIHHLCTYRVQTHMSNATFPGSSSMFD